MNKKEKQLARAWFIAQILSIFGLPTLAFFLFGFTKWSLIFSGFWVPSMAIFAHSINKDLAEYYARNERIVIIRQRKR